MTTSSRSATKASNAKDIELRPGQLTPRRREILELVSKGLTNDEIGKILTLSAGTVRIQLSHILAELQVANRTEATAVYLAWKAQIEAANDLPTRAAIAITSFVAIDETPETERVARAISDDLAMLYERWCWFPVVRANEAPSVDTINPRPYRRDPRIVVSGSIRATRGHWRINVRVDDTRENRVLWTERFDVSADEALAAQDSICETIVATTYELLGRSFSPRSLRTSQSGAIDAWTLAHEAMQLQSCRDASLNNEAQRRFRKAIELEPTLVLAHYGLGLCQFDALLNQLHGADANAVLASAQRCLDLAPHCAQGYYLLARHYQAHARHREAIAPLEQAIARNGSFAPAHSLLGQVLAIVGETDRAVVQMEYACKLAPRSYAAGLAALKFLMGDYAEATAQSERVIATLPSYPFGYVMAMSSCYWQGRLEDARGYLRALREVKPDYSPELFLRTFGGGFAGLERLVQGARAVEALDAAAVV